MRIAFLSIHGYVDPVPNPGLTDTGGQVVYVLEMAKKLGEENVSVDIFTRRFGGRKELEPVARNVRIIRIPCGPPRFVPKEKLYLYLEEYARNFLRYIEMVGLKYDIIHSHYWDAGFVALIAREELGVPMFHTSHSLGLLKKIMLGDIGKKVEYGFDVRIETERKILRMADKLVSASPIEPEYVTRYYGIVREFDIIPPGVDIRFFNPKTKNIDIDVPKIYVFTTGRIEWTKGFDLLVKAFGKAVKYLGDVKLLIGGGSLSPSKLEKEIRDRISRLSRGLGISDKVVQLGRIPNDLLPAYYAKSRVVVLPSRYDLFGMVAIEALACGRPVIVSKYAGVHKLIRDDFGYIVDPLDEEDLAEKIILLVRDRYRADRMGHRGRMYVEKNLTWKKLALDLKAIYENFLGQ